MALSIDEGVQRIANILTGADTKSPWLMPPEKVCKKDRAIKNAKKAREEMKNETEDQKANPAKICRLCGVPFEPYKNGCVHMPICRECLGKRISERKPGGFSHGVDERSGRIAIDFSNDLELLDKLSRTAKRERRTLQQQILHALDRSVNQSEKEF